MPLKPASRVVISKESWEIFSSLPLVWIIATLGLCLFLIEESYEIVSKAVCEWRYV